MAPSRRRRVAPQVFLTPTGGVNRVPTLGRSVALLFHDLPMHRIEVDLDLGPGFVFAIDFVAMACRGLELCDDITLLLELGLELGRVHPLRLRLPGALRTGPGRRGTQTQSRSKQCAAAGKDGEALHGVSSLVTYGYQMINILIRNQTMPP
ncbi:hypothetical protein THIARS_50186 [Thiomonas delicata]|uniref:Uncharacterized protein n=1 Tax=Thiomonas delicata TaxID=364030 RepID=A0A238D0Z4_THIDL|nr:hypothetical protein THIARS_50186 [Thiomonas delicata]